MPILISVIIVTYNRHEDVKETVDSLINQSNKPFEIFLIDDCSNPPLHMDFISNKVNVKIFQRGWRECR